jgi:DNA-binding NarL/FixJ family response regulator
LAQSLKPDVVLMDVVMPNLNGVEALRRLHAQMPKIKVIILSSYRELEYVHPALEAGAAGYLLKHSAAGELLRAIRDAYAGKTVLSPAIEQSLRQERQARFAVEGRAVQARTALSPREREVLQLIAEGLANKQMAAELGISIKTVEKHRQHAINWQPVGTATNVLGTGAIVTIIDRASGCQAMSFYRARLIEQ